VRSSNPVLTRLGEAASAERSIGYGPITTDRMMSLDDVVVRTVGLLVLTGVSGALSWNLLTGGPNLAVAAIGSSLAGLVLGLVIAFARITNPFVIGAYAVVEGVLLGLVSKWFEAAHPGIVIQAVVGTFGVFAGMAVLYKLRVLRATPKFTRFVIGALIGVVVLSLVNWIVAMFGGNLHLIEYGVNGKVGFLPILFSLVCIGVGALTFILDFDQIEQGVRYGLPEKYAWYCAFGLLVGLIFLYWQILRLLGYLRR
jgi:uncharacterized YccA/Bax inhibitor family protein